ncbi:lipopolysaccharide biosynthesis protein [Streptococcus ovis]|uniref:lipopolysaccharide biosynthesis protein n=1 Tax=Streptococcus ovis TaxID=82806 RepID=UPI00036FE212|nr:hypothetical protein [Streptococcus ovis]
MSSQAINEKSNYVWNMIGSIFTALISTVLLLIASRLLSPASSDLFGLAYSLGQQFIIIGLFQVRDFQATDVRQTYSFSSYLLTRMVTVGLMVASTLGFIWWNQYNLEKSVVLFLLVLCRACDAFSDVFQGYYQQRGRSDLAGKILFYRSLAVMIGFFVLLLATKSLMLACLGIFLLNFSIIFLLDLPYLHSHLQEKMSIVLNRESFEKVIALLKSCFPLFLNGFLLTYVFNEPKLVIDKLLTTGELAAGLQRNFNILFMPAFVMSLMLMILRPLITKLSDFWLEKKYQEFYGQFGMISLILTGLGFLVVALGYFIGTEVLGIVFGVALTSYKLPFAILLIGGVFYMLAAIIGNIMTIFRKQTNLLLVYLITFMVSKLVTNPLVTQYGMLGAALSFLLSMIAFLAASFLVYWFVNRALTRINNISK